MTEPLLSTDGHRWRIPRDPLVDFAWYLALVALLCAIGLVAVSHAQEKLFTRQDRWDINIVTRKPAASVIKPVELEFHLDGNDLTGEDFANFLIEQSDSLKQFAIYRRIVLQAADRCRKVDKFTREDDDASEGNDWLQAANVWTSTIKPTPASLGPVVITVTGSGAWTKEQPMEMLEAYSDEFDGDTLDAAKWKTDIGSWSDYWSWSSSDHVRVADGKLYIKTSHDPHERAKADGSGAMVTVPYKSGIIETKAPPLLYGYFEARIKASPKHPGVCPAFWLRNPTATWDTEIDAIELTQQQSNVKTLDFATHVFRLPGETGRNQRSVKHSTLAAWDPRDDFHVYAVKWTKQSIFWYVDGVEVAAQPNTMHGQPLNVVLSMGIRPPLTTDPSADAFPAEMEVDYVRVFFSSSRSRSQ